MTDQEYQLRKEAALLEMEGLVGVWKQFFTAPPEANISIPNSEVVIKPLSSYTESIVTLPAEIEASWVTITEVLNELVQEEPEPPVLP